MATDRLRTGRTFKRAGEKTWSIYWWDRGGKRHTMRTRETSRSRAQRLADQKQAEALGPRDAPTLRDYCDLRGWFRDHCSYSAAKGLKPSTREGHRYRLYEKILPDWGDRPLDEINTVEFERWILSLKKYKNRSKNALKNTLSIVYDQAMREALVSSNPIARVYFLKEDDREERPGLTTWEISKLFPADKETFEKVWDPWWHGVFFEVQFATAARTGEMRALMWDAIIVPHRIVRLFRLIDSRREITLPKAKKVTSVLVPQRTMARLARWRDDTPFPTSRFVFTNTGTTPIEAKYIPQYLAAGIRKCNHVLDEENSRRGLPEQHVRRITPHQLRHTYNTRLRDIGLPDDLIRQLMRHGSIRMTDHYDHPELTIRERGLSQYAEPIEEIFPT